MNRTRDLKGPPPEGAGCLFFLWPVGAVYLTFLGGETLRGDPYWILGLLFLLASLGAVCWAWFRYAVAANAFSLGESVLIQRKRLGGKTVWERVHPLDHLTLLVDRKVGSHIDFSVFTRDGKKLALHRMPAQPYEEVYDFGRELAQDLQVDYRSLGDRAGPGSARIHHDDAPHRIRLEHRSFRECCFGCLGCALLYLGLAPLAALDETWAAGGALMIFFALASSVIAYRSWIFSEYFILDLDRREIFKERSTFGRKKQIRRLALHEIDSLALEAKVSYDRSGSEMWFYGLSACRLDGRRVEILPPQRNEAEDIRRGGRRLAEFLELPFHDAEDKTVIDRVKPALPLSTEERVATSRVKPALPLSTEERVAISADQAPASGLEVTHKKPHSWLIALSQAVKTVILVLVLSTLLIGQIGDYAGLWTFAKEGNKTQGQVISWKDQEGSRSLVTYRYSVAGSSYERTSSILTPRYLREGASLPVLYLPEDPDKSLVGTPFLSWEGGYWQKHVLNLFALAFLDLLATAYWLKTRRDKKPEKASCCLGTGCVGLLFSLGALGVLILFFSRPTVLSPAPETSLARILWKDSRNLELHARFVHEGRSGEMWVSKKNDRFRVEYDRSPWTVVGSLSKNHEFWLKNGNTGKTFALTEEDPELLRVSGARRARALVMSLKFAPAEQRWNRYLVRLSRESRFIMLGWDGRLYQQRFHRDEKTLLYTTVDWPAPFGVAALPKYSVEVQSFEEVPAGRFQLIE